MMDHDSEELQCNTCYRRLTAPPRGTDDVQVSHVDKDDPDCCPRCGKKVYFAEQFMVLGRKWHNTCFSCGK